MTLPAGFQALYRWRDGQDNKASDSFEGNKMFMSLAAITRAKTGLDRMIGTTFKDPEFWRREWIPFLDDGGGNYTVVDVKAKGRLLDFWHDEDDHTGAQKSVEAWLAEVAASMEDGSDETL